MANSSIQAETLRLRQPGDQRGGHLVDGEQPGKDAGAGDNDEDLRREQHCGDGSFEDVAPGELAKDEARHERSIDTGDRGGLGGREHAAVDAAENDHRRAKRPYPAHCRAEKRTPRKGLSASKVSRHARQMT